jgi:hypothetical protein
MRVELERASHKGWESWHLRRGPLELVLVPQVGGRIMGMKWQGLDLAFTQPEREGIVEHVGRDGAVRARKRELGFPPWGGDKTWLAPQSRWTDELPFLDLDSGPYDLAIDQATHERVQVSMVSPVCRETGMRITRTVVLSSSDDEWRVIHRLTNASINEVGWGAWDVSMVARPGKVYLPVNPASPYPGGVKTFANEGDSSRLRDAVVSDLGTVAVVECNQPSAFKFGVDAVEGWMLGVIQVAGHGLVGYRKRVPFWPGAEYGHGCVTEVYNSDRYSYLEMEIHGPVERLRPGESFQMEERQAVFDLPDWPVSDVEVRALGPSLPRAM